MPLPGIVGLSQKPALCCNPVLEPDTLESLHLARGVCKAFSCPGDLVLCASCCGTAVLWLSKQLTDCLAAITYLRTTLEEVVFLSTTQSHARIQ